MISERLLTIASLVPRDAIVADIGSDHALLPCYLVEKNIVSKAYAIDNKKGPLSGAIENIKSFGYENQVFPVLSDGLQNLAEDANTVVIAGMGYSTISKMLSDDMKYAQKQDRLIIQCNNHLHKMRKFLYTHNFQIEEEKFLFLNGIDYIIMAVKYTNDKLEDSSFYISEYLVNTKDEEYYKFLKNRIQHLENLKDFNEDFKQEYETIKAIL